MVLSLFRSNQLVVGILLIFYILLLHAAAFLLPPPALASPMGIGSLLLVEWLGDEPRFEPFVPVVLVFLQAMLASYLIFQNRLLPSLNLFAGVLLALVASAAPSFLWFHPMQAANVFLLLALIQLAATFRVAAVADRIFNTGFHIGLASLFAAPYLWFLIAGIAGLVVLRTTRMREILMLLIGALVPHLLAGVVYFWFDRFDLYWSRQWLLPFGLPILQPIQLLDWISLILLLILVAVVLFSYNANLGRTTIEVRKRVDLIYWILLIGSLSLLTYAGVTAAHMQVLAVPLGILLAFNFTRADQRTAEAVHLVLLTIVLLLQFYPVVT